MGYTATTYIDGASAVPISAANLNKTEQALVRSAGFDTVADLRAAAVLPYTTAARTLGHTTAGDGGHGDWYYDALSTDDDDGVFTIKPAAVSGAGRWKRRDRYSGLAQWSGSDTITLYVDTAGSDSNHGLAAGASTALATIQAAFDKIAAAGSSLYGTWVVQLAAGSYAGATLARVHSKNRIRVLGPTAGHPNVPTAVVDASLDARNDGLEFNGIRVEVRDILVQDYAGSGVLARNGADCWCVNVHTSSNGFAGINGQDLCQLRVQGGILDGDQHGVRCYGYTWFEIGDNAASLAQGPIIRNSVFAGVRVQSSYGGVTYTTLDNCNNGVYGLYPGRVKTAGCDIKNNASTGIRMLSGCAWTEEGAASTFTGNGQNVFLGVGSIETSMYGVAGAQSEAMIYRDLAGGSHTGTTALAQVVRTWEVPGGWFTESARKIRVVVRGSCTGATAKMVGVYFDGSTALAAPTLPGGAFAFRMEVDVWATGAAAQEYAVTVTPNGANPVVVHGARTINMAANRDLDIVCQLGNTGDSVSVTAVEVFVMG